MKLDQSIIDYIENVVKTAQSVNIDNVIIEKDMVRAIDDNREVVLYQDADVPELPFGSIGFNRIGVFLSRYDIAKTRDDFVFNVIIDDDDYVGNVNMTSTGTKIGYKCRNPAKIQAPRQINDTLVYSVQLSAEAVSLMQKGEGAMGAESIVFTGGDGVSFELLDMNGDVFKHKFAPDFDFLDNDADDSFSQRYPIKVILSLFKQNPEGIFKIGEKGILNIVVNDLNFFVLPQV